MLAMAILVVGTQGLFGLEPDGLAAVFAIALAMPWSLIALPALNTSELMIGVVLALCMLLNVGILGAIGAMLSGKRLLKS
jgi:hypothetical protein